MALVYLISTKLIVREMLRKGLELKVTNPTWSGIMLR